MSVRYLAGARADARSPTGSSAPTGYRVRVSDAAEDPDWDEFLGRVGAHHTQSAAWGRVKVGDGWRPLRVIVEDGSRIVAGAQLLHRRVGRLGRLGYLSRGPVAREQGTASRLLQALDSACRDAGVRGVLVEPDPVASSGLDPTAAATLVPAHLRSSLGATVLLDIRKHPEDLLAGMHKKTRYNVRLAQRRGITVRPGDQRDLEVFHQLLTATGRRQGFEPAARSQYRRWFEVLGEEGHLKLFVAECDGEPVSAMIAIAFGDTVVYKRGAWSGRHGDLRPNEALHWTAIRWAHEAGYHWYDLDGIDRAAAERAHGGEPVPAHYLNSVTRFKLGFGGEVLLLPESLVHLRGEAARRLYSRIGPRLSETGAHRRLRPLSR